MFMKRWCRCERSASNTGRPYLSRLATTNEVSRIGTASTSSGKSSVATAAVLSRPWTDSVPSVNPSSIAPESPMKIRAG